MGICSHPLRGGPVTLLLLSLFVLGNVIADDTTKNAKRLIVQMRPDAVSTMAYESNPAVSQVLTVSATDGTSVLALAPDADMSAVRAQLENDPGVEFVEVDQVVSINAGTPDNDPMLPQQWGLSAIRAPMAWNTNRGSPGVRVCVIDTGVDSSHPDLSANIRSAGSLVTILNGQQTNGANDENGHGTHVAGIVAGVGDNNLGISGVSQVADIWGCRFMDSQGNGYLSDATECVKWCARNGIKVISASWGGAGSRPVSLERALQDFGSKGGLFVNAALNFGTDLDEQPLYPASLKLSNMLVVGALDNTLQRAPYSCYGRHTVNLFAPGSDVLSTVPVSKCGNAAVGCYERMSGTSMATPFVAGQAALLMATGACSGSSCKPIIQGTIRPLSQLEGLCKHPGIINVAASLGKKPKSPKPPTPSPKPPSPSPGGKGSTWFGIPIPDWVGRVPINRAASTAASDTASTATTASTAKSSPATEDSMRVAMRSAAVSKPLTPPTPPPTPPTPSGDAPP